MAHKRIWFISDPHFHHANMVRGGKIGIRSQFENVEQMNDYIVTAINETVAPHEKLYILGDITLDRRDTKSLEIVRRLHGHKRLIPGNHDHFPLPAYLDAGFEKVIGYREMAGILFSHIPIHPNQFYRFHGNVHGHTHTQYVKRNDALRLDPVQIDDWRYMNVCVEAVNYTPVLLDQIVAHFQNRR